MEGVSSKLVKPYVICQKELHLMLNFFQMEEIKRCKGALVEQPLSMAQIFHDYRDSYGDATPAGLALRMDNPQMLYDSQEIIDDSTLKTIQKTRHAWCTTHTWPEVIMFDSKLFNDFRYHPKSGAIYVTHDITSALLAFHHLMLETHPDQFDRDKFIGFLKNILQDLDSKITPMTAMKDDLTYCGGLVTVDKPPLHELREFDRNYDFQALDEMEKAAARLQTRATKSSAFHSMRMKNKKSAGTHGV